MATSLNLDIAQELNITVRKGDSFSFDITVKDADGDAVDLSGYEFDMDVRNSLLPGRENVVLSTTASAVEDFIIPLMFAKGEADGTLNVKASRIEMEKVPDGSFLFDIQATNPSDSSSQTWFYGVFVINADVSDYI